MILRGILLVAMLAGAGSWLALAQTNAPPAPARTGGGANGLGAPKFVLRGPDHKQVRLADYRGRGLLVAFLLSSAAPCQEQLAGLVELQSRYGGAGFSVLGLLLDDPGTNAVRELIATNRLNFPVLFADYETIEGFGGLRAVPTLILVDGQHLVQTQMVGLTEKSVLEPAIQSVLTR